MATAKKQVKTKTRAPKGDYTKVELPAGFTAIASTQYGEVWEYEKHPVLVGKVMGDVRSVTQKALRKGEKPRDTRVITVRSEADGKVYAVWESTALEEFFNHVMRGMRIAITFHGLRDVGRPQPMKVFQGAFTDEDAAEFVDDENDDTPPPAAKRKTAAKKKTRK